MKANESPEKLYISNYDSEVRYNWHPERLAEKDIEYTRTDAFIEKVCEWLSDTLQTIRDIEHPSKHHVESIPVLGDITQTEFLEKFKKEIKFLLD